jgi:transposase InsO family protein
VKRLSEFCHPHDPPCPHCGLARQRLARERELILRGNVVELIHWTANFGLSLPQAAERLHLSSRTLRHWCDSFLIATPTIHLLGRPTQRSSLADRTDVLDVLKELGPTTSVATLRECFPSIARSELEDLLRRFRRVWQKRYRATPYMLHWQRVGAVWAIDFSEAPCLIDGAYPNLLAVRDLASHQQLLWMPTHDMHADTTVDALQMLFTIHGAPLVLKADNGSAFIAGATRDFLSPYGVELLFSPPHTPRYNGSIEAGIGSLKTRTERYASRDGHPGYWTSHDVAAAQSEANAAARPQGETGPTPDDLWHSRRPITAAERQFFQQTVQNHREDAGERIDETTREGRQLQREAIRRALVEHDILCSRGGEFRYQLAFKNRQTLRRGHTVHINFRWRGEGIEVHEDGRVWHTLCSTRT